MEYVAEFWTEIDNVSRRRSIRRAIGAIALVATVVGGTMAGSSAGYYEVAGAIVGVV